MTEEEQYGLRRALQGAIREKDAVKDMFEQDTGADEVSMNRQNDHHYTVTLHYWNLGDQ